MTNSIIDSKQCKNCQTEIMLSKQKCPYCNENNEWEPELGIKPYLAFKTIWYVLLYPLFFPIFYLMAVFRNPSLPDGVVIPFLIISTVMTVVGISVMSKNFELGKALFTLNGVSSFLFTIFHLRFGVPSAFEGIKLVVLIVNVVTWYYVTHEFYSLEAKYQTRLERNK